MNNFRFATAEDFNPAELGKSLCMNFDAARSAFAENPDNRINGALSGYIYDMPQFPGDQVKGGIHYAKYVELASSLIPQKQPSLLSSLMATQKVYTPNKLKLLRYNSLYC